MKTLVTLFLLFAAAAYAQPDPKIQLVHNSADTSVLTLKVWINDTVWAPQLPYMSATPEHTLAPGIYTVGVSHVSAASQSLSYTQSTIEVNPGSTNFLAVIGIQSSGPQYNPGSTQRPLTIFTRTLGPVGTPFMLQCGVAFYHLSTDSPSLTVISGGDTLGSNVAYQSWNHALIMAGTRTLSIAGSTAAVGTATYNFPGGVNIRLLSTGFTNTLVNARTTQAGGGKPFNLCYVPPAGGALTPVQIKRNETTGLSDQQKEAGISVYPVPARDELFLKCSACSEALDVLITDMNGKVVLHRPAHEPSKPLDIRSLAKGAYFVQINGQGEKVVQRLIVE